MAGAFWIWLSSTSPGDLTAGIHQAPQVGFYTPDISLATIEGNQLDLANLIGSPLIINFWTSWCPPCKAEMPDFQQAYLEYLDSDLKIVTINSTIQDSLPDVISFVENNQLTFPILLDTSGTVTRAYNIHSLPTTFIVDRNGIIKKVLVGGPLPLSLIRVEINKLLLD